jgi:Ran GTPase-activating protein (RanGAP) involved in mRNA processing and transport
MIKLSSYLLRSKTLISLDLTNNQISGEGGFAISLVIKENTGLKNIKLAMNRFDDQNASLILKALTKNTLLEEIDLSSNELGILVNK